MSATLITAGLLLAFPNDKSVGYPLAAAGGAIAVALALWWLIGRLSSRPSSPPAPAALTAGRDIYRAGDGGRGGDGNEYGGGAGGGGGGSIVVTHLSPPDDSPPSAAV